MFSKAIKVSFKNVINLIRVFVALYLFENMCRGGSFLLAYTVVKVSYLGRSQLFFYLFCTFTKSDVFFHLHNTHYFNFLCKSNIIGILLA